MVLVHSKLVLLRQVRKLADEQDLCVRYEGTFRLRMRVFDLSSVEEFATAGEQFLAQAFSGLFKVYSPRK